MNGKKITSDKNILDVVKNCEIEFINNIAPTKCELFEPRFNAIESEVIDQDSKFFEHGSYCRGVS